MSNIKQRYELLVQERGWDSETQLQFFLAYAEEYNLADHYLSYLGLKPAAKTKNLVSSKEYPIERLIELVVKNDRITEVIKENALAVADDNPWTDATIIKCIADGISVAVDPADRKLMKELVTYFNLRHTSFSHPQPQPDMSQQAETKPTDGDDYFEKLFKRYANFG